MALPIVPGYTVLDSKGDEIQFSVEVGGSFSSATCVVSGVVKDDTGKRLDGVTIEIGGKTAVTGKNIRHPKGGYYTIADVPIPLPNAPQPITATLGAGSLLIKSGDDEITIISGTTKQTHDITILSYGPRPVGSTCIVSGIVKDDTGKRLDGVTVEIGGKTAVTGKTARYLKGGYYKILDVSIPLPVTPIPITAALGSGSLLIQSGDDEITIPIGTKTQSHDITILSYGPGQGPATPTCTVSGIVTDDTGKRLDGVTITIGGKTAVTSKTTRHLKGGYYTIADVPVLLPVAPIPITATLGVGSLLIKSGDDEVTIPTGTKKLLHDITIVSYGPGHATGISGEVTDNSTGTYLSGVIITVIDSSGNSFTASTNSSGQYSLFVSVGTYSVTATLAGYKNYPISPISPLTVIPGKITTHDFVMELAPSGTGGIEGIVTDSITKKVLKNVDITINHLSGSTNSLGYYSIAGLAPNSYIVSGVLKNYKDYISPSPGALVTAGISTKFDFEMTPIQTSSQEEIILSGTIVDSDGKGLSGKTLRAYIPHPGKPGEIMPFGKAISNPDGTYEIKVSLPNKTTIHVIEIRDENDSKFSSKHGTIHSDPFDVTTGTPVTDIDVCEKGVVPEIVVEPLHAYMSSSKPDPALIQKGTYSAVEKGELQHNPVHVILKQHKDTFIGSVNDVPEDHALDLHFSILVKNLSVESNYVYDYGKIALFYSSDGKWLRADGLGYEVLGDISVDPTASSSPKDLTIRIRALYSMFNTIHFMVHCQVTLNPKPSKTHLPSLTDVKARGAFVLHKSETSHHDAMVKVVVKNRFGIVPKYNLFGLNISQDITVAGTGLLGRFKKTTQTNQLYSQDTFVTDDNGVCTFRIPAKKMSEGPLKIDLDTLTNKTREGRERMKLLFSEMSFDPSDGILQQQTDNTYNITITITHSNESRMRSVFIELYEMRYEHSGDKGLPPDTVIELAKKNAVPAKGVKFNFKVLEGSSITKQYIQSNDVISGETNSQGLYKKQFAPSNDPEKQLLMNPGSIMFDNDDYFIYEFASPRNTVEIAPVNGEWPHVKVYVIKKQDCILKMNYQLTSPLEKLPANLYFKMVMYFSELLFKETPLKIIPSHTYERENLNTRDVNIVIPHTEFFKTKSSDHFSILEIIPATSKSSFYPSLPGYSIVVPDKITIYPFESSRNVSVAITKHTIKEYESKSLPEETQTFSSTKGSFILDKEVKKRLEALEKFVTVDLKYIKSTENGKFSFRNLKELHEMLDQDLNQLNTFKVKIGQFIEVSNNSRQRFAFASKFYSESPKLISEFEKLQKKVTTDVDGINAEVAKLYRYINQRSHTLIKGVVLNNDSGIYPQKLPEIMGHAHNSIQGIPSKYAETIEALTKLPIYDSSNPEKGPNWHQNSLNMYLYYNLDQLLRHYTLDQKKMIALDAGSQELFKLLREYHRSKNSLSMDQEKELIKDLDIYLSLAHEALVALWNDLEGSSTNFQRGLKVFEERAEKIVGLLDFIINYVPPKTEAVRVTFGK